MEKLRYNIIEFSHPSSKYGFVFEIDDRQFGLTYTDTVVHVHDLYTGGRVLWFQFNDLLKLNDEFLIEFAKFYISNIKSEQFDLALKQVKKDYPFIDFPVNQKIDFQSN